MNKKELLKEIELVFKPPIKKTYLGKLSFGTPYFWPRNFCNTIIKTRKLKLSTQEELDKLPNDFAKKNKKFSNLPMVRRSKYWTPKIFGKYYYIEVGWPISIKRTQLGWKGKWDSPRYEWSPAFQIFFFNWQYCSWWNAPDSNNDRYYEMILWYLYYSDKDINKARDSWGWIDGKTKKSTWNNNYLYGKKEN